MTELISTATGPGGRRAYQLLAPLPRARNHRTIARQQAAIGRAVGVFQEILDRLEPEQLDQLAAEIADILEARPDDPARATFARELAGVRDYSREERASLHLQTLLRTFRRREELLGDALTAPQVARLLHTSRQSPHDRVDRGTLLAAVDRGARDRAPIVRYLTQIPLHPYPSAPEPQVVTGINGLYSSSSSVRSTSRCGP